MPDYLSLRPAERDALKQEIFSSLHVALPGNIVSYDPETQTAEIQPAVRAGSVSYPILSSVPVFMPVPFDISPGDPCLVVFADVDISAWLQTGEAAVPGSARRHSLSDGLAFVGWKAAAAVGNGG